MRHGRGRVAGWGVRSLASQTTHVAQALITGKTTSALRPHFGIKVQGRERVSAPHTRERTAIKKINTTHPIGSKQ